MYEIHLGFKFNEICVFYRKVIQLYVRCKKMQHFQNNVANNVVIYLRRISKLRKESYVMRYKLKAQVLENDGP